MFSQEKIFLFQRKFYTNKDFSFIKEVFYNQRLFLHWETLPQSKVFPSSRKFFIDKDFFLIKEVLQKQSFLVHQRRLAQAWLFLLQESLPEANTFSSTRKLSRSKFYLLKKRFSIHALHKKFFKMILFYLVVRKVHTYLTQISF